MGTTTPDTTKGIWSKGHPGMHDLMGEIHVWRISISSYENQAPELIHLLSEDERERSGRFHFRKDQVRFIVIRGLLRIILGNYLGVSGRELRFRYGPFGKPELTDEWRQKVHFNLSHSGDYALVAVSSLLEIGIDIEMVRNDLETEVISNRFFSKQEINCLNTLLPGDRNDLFHKYWTRKEAFIKALGKGVSFPLENCDVSLLNGMRLMPVTVSENNSDGSPWYGMDLKPGIGYVAAVVIGGEGCKISCWQY